MAAGQQARVRAMSIARYVMSLVISQEVAIDRGEELINMWIDGDRSMSYPLKARLFIAKDQDPVKRATTDQSWKNAVARGWTVRTFPGSHTAMLENPKGLAALILEAVNDKNSPVAK